ncbi:hypothetical protein E8E15_000372 [Penicillium rubens]|nr:hypothetical protein E8E15_000372 [Penicillium rubens]
MPAPPPLPPRALAGKASSKPRGNILQSSGPPTRVTKVPRGSKSQLRVEIPPSSSRYLIPLTTSQDLQSTKRFQEEVDWEAEHHDCLMYLEQADAEVRKLKGEINSTQSEDSQSMQQLRGKNTQATANLHRITSDHAQMQQNRGLSQERCNQAKQACLSALKTPSSMAIFGILFSQ